MIRMVLVLVAASALPLHAQGFSPPEGCTAFMTVQARACRVSNYYRCAADVPGDQWRADFDQEGVFFLSRIDREAQWVESFDISPMVRQTLDAGAQDPASFTDLLAGEDTYAFGLSKDDGTQSRVHGFDRLTGKSMVIDGIALQQTEFDFTETAPDGTILRRARGHEYMHPSWRVFFAGPGEADLGDGDWLPVDGSPVQFIFPGEPGYLSTQPIFECDAQMSSYPMPRHPPIRPDHKEAQSHDDL